MDGFQLAERIMNAPSLAGPLIMMLTSGEQIGDSAKCRELGIAAHLTKPIRRAELKAAIVKVLANRPGRKSAVPLIRSEARPLLPTHGAHTAARLQVLLAEDNEVNQRVAIKILEKAGHHVVPVGNGTEALKALFSQTFDVVLMDVQMPEMDGIEAARAIRRCEQKTSLHVPIIALTAHAMSDDRERCLEAGMDDYISKPVNARALLEIVERYAPQLVTAD
jgi:two-component system sensor histidine kinase/response regulator